MFSRAVEAEVALPANSSDRLPRPALPTASGASVPRGAAALCGTPSNFLPEALRFGVCCSGSDGPIRSGPTLRNRFPVFPLPVSCFPVFRFSFPVSRLPSPVLCLPPLPPPSFVPTAAAPLPEQLRLRPPERPAPRFEIRYLYYRTSGGESLPLHSETSPPASPFPLRSTPCMALPRTVRRRKSRPVGRCRESNRRDYGKILRYAL